MSGRIRTIKPELLEDERVAALSDMAFRAFLSSIVMADDHGNLRAEPRFFRGTVYWAHDSITADDVAEALREVAASGLHTPYVVNGQRYVAISGWSKHQRVDNAGKPRVPGPEAASDSADDVAEVRRESPRIDVEIPRPSAIGGETPKGNQETTEKRDFRDSPRVSANRGGLPLDLRPPTSDPDRRPPTREAGEAPVLESKLGPQEAIALRLLRQHPILADIATPRAAVRIVSKVGLMLWHEPDVADGIAYVAGKCDDANAVDAPRKPVDKLAAVFGAIAKARSRRAEGVGQGSDGSPPPKPAYHAPFPKQPWETA